MLSCVFFVSEAARPAAEGKQPHRALTLRTLPRPSALSGTSRLFPESLGTFRLASARSGTPSMLRSSSSLAELRWVGPVPPPPHPVPDSFRSLSALSVSRENRSAALTSSPGRLIKRRAQAARAVRGGGRGAGGESCAPSRWGGGTPCPPLSHPARVDRGPSTPAPPSAAAETGVRVRAPLSRGGGSGRPCLRALPAGTARLPLWGFYGGHSGVSLRPSGGEERRAGQGRAGAQPRIKGKRARSGGIRPGQPRPAAGISFSALRRG